MDTNKSSHSASQARREMERELEQVFSRWKASKLEAPSESDELKETGDSQRESAFSTTQFSASQPPYSTSELQHFVKKSQLTPALNPFASTPEPTLSSATPTIQEKPAQTTFIATIPEGSIQAEDFLKELQSKGGTILFQGTYRERNIQGQGIEELHVYHNNGVTILCDEQENLLRELSKEESSILLAEGSVTRACCISSLSFNDINKAIIGNLGYRPAENIQFTNKMGAMEGMHLTILLPKTSAASINATSAAVAELLQGKVNQTDFQFFLQNLTPESNEKLESQLLELSAKLINRTEIDIAPTARRIAGINLILAARQIINKKS